MKDSEWYRNDVFASDRMYVADLPSKLYHVLPFEILFHVCVLLFDNQEVGLHSVLRSRGPEKEILNICFGSYTIGTYFEQNNVLIIVWAEF